MKPRTTLQRSCLALLTLGLLSITLIYTSAAQSPANVRNKGTDKPGNSDKGNQQSERPRHEPPPQAFEKCKGKKEGDTVQIITPRGDKISGRCSVSEKGLFAKPERPPQPPAER